jgi:hypothetical protein
VAKSNQDRLHVDSFAAERDKRGRHLHFFPVERRKDVTHLNLFVTQRNQDEPHLDFFRYFFSFLPGYVFFADRLFF